MAIGAASSTDANPFIVKLPNGVDRCCAPPVVFSSAAGVKPEKSGAGEPNPRLDGVCCACGVTACGTNPPLNVSYGCAGTVESYGFGWVVIGAGGVHALLLSTISVGWPYGLVAAAGTPYGLAGTGARYGFDGAAATPYGFVGCSEVIGAAYGFVATAIVGAA